jgi:predicted nucleotidyltransferase
MPGARPWYDPAVPELERQILDALAGVPELALVVLFGSRATGRARPDSDLDLAILPAEGSAIPRRKLVARVAVDLAELAPHGRVDVVLLDEAPVVLRQRIMETGRVLRCDDPAAWRVRTMREYGDTERVRRLLRRAQYRRLSGGERSGRSGRALVSLERAGRLAR